MSDCEQTLTLTDKSITHSNISRESQNNLSATLTVTHKVVSHTYGHSRVVSYTYSHSRVITHTYSHTQNCELHLQSHAEL
ncbi:hypothetical protein EB796_010029 [Bugula neritina]|uniref:Uncharacterized protein n=1 Tax=Bugula neritina TaxID=10212 RepID=A0A7J7K236_BUGNE|nr:hypothetical protein EB796_010029 [Bugula neritina]